MHFEPLFDVLGTLGTTISLFGILAVVGVPAAMSLGGRRGLCRSLQRSR